MNKTAYSFLLFGAAILAFMAILPPAFGRDASVKELGLQGKTSVKGIVILVTFSDVDNSVDKNRVQMRFTRHLNAYIREMSYGKVSLEVDVTKDWIKMPKPVSRYRISSRNLQVDKSRVRELIDDALHQADKEVDFSRYSFTVIFMKASLQEYGMIGLCGYPGMLGWGSKDSLKLASGESVKGGVAIFCFQAHLGTLFHDVAHILGGVREGKRMVPCLYDHDLQAKPGPMRKTFLDAIINMGFWDPMSCHFYRWNLPPPGLSSWTKMRLNWLDTSKIKIVRPGERAELMLDPLEEGSAETLVVKIPISAATYYLVENRQPIGFDKNLPGSGILIMVADDRIAECRHGKAPVRLMDANPSIPHLEGAAYDIGGKDTFEDPKNKIRIQLREKIGGTYRITVSPL
ncbi:MAG: hypothetical protein K9N21_19820 [Deltaproteobacteria bacterium]|nr:hypothetical protein [Deltaproteobacteria bacterium]